MVCAGKVPTTGAGSASSGCALVIGVAVGFRSDSLARVGTSIAIGAGAGVVTGVCVGMAIGLGSGAPSRIGVGIATRVRTGDGATAGAGVSERSVLGRANSSGCAASAFAPSSPSTNARKSPGDADCPPRPPAGCRASGPIAHPLAGSGGLAVRIDARITTSANADRGPSGSLSGNQRFMQRIQAFSRHFIAASAGSAIFSSRA